MAKSRTELHALLVEAAGEGHKVYFQPPASVQMEYPCIVYKVDNMDTLFADNMPYRSTKRYTVTIIDLDPESDISVRVAALPLSSFDRNFVVDNLHHDVFTLYF